MSTRTIWLAVLCLAAFAVSAPASEAQRVSGTRTVVDPSRFDGAIDDYQDGVKFYQQGNYKMAETYLNKFLGRVGEHAGGNFMMGLVQIELNDLDKAKTYMVNAVKFDPQMAAPRGWLGAINVVNGDIPAALEQKKALEGLKAACAETCPKAADINTAIQRIDENVAAAQQPAPAAPPAG